MTGLYDLRQNHATFQDLIGWFLMKGVLLFYLILLSSSGFSSVEILSEIHDIDLGNHNESPIILLTSGHAVRIDSHQKTCYIN